MFKNIMRTDNFKKYNFSKSVFVTLIFTVFAKLGGIRQQPFNYDYKIHRSDIFKSTIGLTHFAFQCLGTQLERLKQWEAITAVWRTPKRSFLFISVAELGLLTKALKHASPCSLDSSQHGGCVMTENYRGASVSKESSGRFITFSDLALKSHSDHSVALSWLRVVTILSDSREGDIDSIFLCKNPI